MLKLKLGEFRRLAVPKKTELPFVHFNCPGCGERVCLDILTTPTTTVWHERCSTVMLLESFEGDRLHMKCCTYETYKRVQLAEAL